MNDSFRKDNPPNYTVVAMAGEVGELLNAYKKHALYSTENPRHRADKGGILDESGDLFYYFIRFLTEQGLTLEDVMQYNMKKLTARMQGG